MVSRRLEGLGHLIVLFKIPSSLLVLNLSAPVVDIRRNTSNKQSNDFFDFYTNTRVYLLRYSRFEIFVCCNSIVNPEMENSLNQNNEVFLDIFFYRSQSTTVPTQIRHNTDMIEMEMRSINRFHFQNCSKIKIKAMIRAKLR